MAVVSLQKSYLDKEHVCVAKLVPRLSFELLFGLEAQVRGILVSIVSR